jgi:2'-5' RNA ligase
MQGTNGEAQTLGWFALVSYIPDPLARFLDDLRIELAPKAKPKAHVTVLPPRPLHDDLKLIVGQITEVCRKSRPFRVELGQMAIFEATQVVYLSLRQGEEELHHLYHSLNSGELAFRECFAYHPHITIAQDLAPGDAIMTAAIANKKWAAFRGPCGFEVKALSFVQHVAPFIWMDVATVPLG